MLAVALSVLCGQVRAQNILVNPGFESGTTGWHLFTNGTGTLASVTPGFAGLRSGQVTITTVGSNMQLYQSDLTLEPATRYTLSFAAYSSGGRDLSVSLLQQVSPFTSYGLSNRVCNLSTGWQVFTIEFETSGFSETVYDARLRFWFVNYAVDGEVYLFDEVALGPTVIPPSAPVITREPVSRTVVAGDTAVFSIAASGTTPLSFRWQKNGADIPGAESPSYVTPPAAPSDSGAGFRCIVSNALGSDTSLTAPMIVSPPLAIRVWYGTRQTFGAVGNPVPALNILGNVFAKDGIASLSATLNGGPPRPLSRGPDSRRLWEKGDFNIDVACSTLQTGGNVIAIEVTDSIGRIARDTVVATYTGTNIWPLPYTADWQTSGSPQATAQAVDGFWRVDAVTGTIRTIQIGYDRLVAIGAQTWTDYEVLAPITIHGIDSSGYAAPSNGPAIGFLLRWPGHSDLPASLAGRQPKTGYLPFGAIAWYHYRSDGERLVLVGNNLQILAQETGARRLAPGVRYLFRARVETIAGVGPRYSLKVWADGTPEPAGWDLTGQEELTDPQQGCLLLLAHHVDASFGPVTVMPAGAPTYALTVQSTGSGSVARDPDMPLYPSGQTVTLTANPEPGWRFDAWSGDLTGSANPASITLTGSRSVTATFSRLPVRPPVVADEFNAPELDTLLWTFVNPLADAGLVHSGSRVSIALPSGPEHDVRADGNTAPRIMQQAADTSFEIEARFASVLSGTGRIQGLLVEQDSANAIRFDLIANGRTTRVHAATIGGGALTVRVDTAIPGGVPLSLRVRRRDSSWTQQFSRDGRTWATAGSFDHPIAVAKVGSFVGNAGNPAPDITGVIEYIRTPQSGPHPVEPLRRERGEPGGTPPPAAYSLGRNYPNPFNAETEIEYSVPSAEGAGGWVSIVLYDMLGREVRRLVDGPFGAGVHRVRLQAQELASGVYYCRMRGGSGSGYTFVETMPVLLLR